MLSSFYRISAIFLMLSAFTQAYAITVYDVIQLSNKNYSDKDIIALVEATDSAFSLNKEDISRLSELGVSDPVLQAMQEAVSSDEVTTQTTTEPTKPHSKDKIFDSSDVISTIPATTTDLVPRADIRSEQLPESGSGHHQHQVITLFGIQLLILRDEANFPSLAERAETIAKRLSAASVEDGEFHPGHVSGKDAVLYTAAGSTQKTLIISVSKNDALAYQRRSGRKVSQDLLAAYWSDLLTDYWTLAMSGQPPERLAKLHEGEALQELYYNLSKDENISTNRLALAFKALPKQERNHLLKLAVSVPDDFISNENHEAE